MQYSNNKYHIATLIYKSVIESLSVEEEITLNAWLEDESNKKHYHRIVNGTSIENKRAIYNSLDKEVAYDSLLRKIQRKEVKKKSNKRRLNLYKYAATLLLLLASGYILFLKNGSINSNVEVVGTINPGYEKATLVLSDGTEVNLEKNKDQVIQSVGGGAQIENRNNTLVYKSQAANEKSVDKEVFNTLYVPIGGIYTLELPDGSKVWVNSSSSLKYPEIFNQDKRIVELEGEAYFEVVKGEKEFIVKTKNRDITVLGTSFNVSSYGDDAFFATTLAEGKVKLTNLSDSTDEVYLKPGQRAFLNKTNGQSITLQHVDTKIYTAWKDGKFYFERETLGKILTKAGRWYDFEVSFSDPSLKNVTFTGVALKGYTAERLLNMIKKSSNIDYEIIKNRTNKKYEVRIKKRKN